MAEAAASRGTVAAADVARAAERIRGAVRETPLLEASAVSGRFGGRVLLKAENLQRTGSFKIRGALNKLALLDGAEVERGVVAASAGNHAQAVAVAARRRGVDAELVMPSEAPLAKVEAVRSYGGRVRFVEGGYEDAAASAHALAASDGRTLVHPFDDPAIVAGAGTVGLELAEQAPETRLVLVSVGGGGLAAGVAIAAKARLPGARVVGVQAEARRRGTICDGIAVKRPGRLTGALLAEHVDELVTVDDDAVAEAMVLLLERSKLVVEGAGAAAVAALVAGRIEPPAEGETCAVLSGGNVDAGRLVECIRLGETAAGRRLVFATVVADRPGELARLLATVAAEDANVLDVMHLREGVDLHVRETAVRLVLETEGTKHGERVLAAVRAAGFRAEREGPG